MNRNDILRALQAGEINLADAKKELTQTNSQVKLQTNSPNSQDELIDGILQTAIAVIGMSGQFPGSNNLSGYWDNLREGKNCITEVPPARWDVDRYFDPDLKVPGKTNCKWMGMLDDIDVFDPLFFSISPAEAELMDPQHRLFLENCWHCVEDAGIRPSQLSGSRCGVFVGCGVSDYGQLSSSQGLNAHGLMGTSPSILSARISYLLNLRGPCLAIDTACSSALVAIAEACNSLILHTSDMALAGGVNFMFGPEAFIKAGKAGMLSKNGRCFTFDTRANGFVPGEGVGVVLLKRLSDAVRDQDHIYGLVRGWGINQDGKTNGITAPSVNSQIALETEVYRRFKIDPGTITMVEAHGTGTKLGDPIEVEALTESFGSFTDKRNYCALGSVKSNIGHLIKAAGIAGVIKVLLSLKYRMIPPTINFENLNEHICLDNTPFYINDRLQPWEVPPGVPRRACISAFGFSGTNSHLVIEEYIPGADTKRAAIPIAVSQNNPALFILSAKSEERLKAYAGSVKRFIEANEDLSLADMVYTLQVGREAMEYRMAFLTESREVLIKALEGFKAGNPPPGVLTGQVRKGKEGLGVLEKDEDAKALVQTWLEKKKIKKVAELWVKGLDLDWNLLYDGTAPQRISIPVYPFAREQYWAIGTDAGTDTGISARTGDGQGVTGAEIGKTAVSEAAVYIHPLLHQNTSDFSVQRFSSDFTGREFFLADHVIKGRRVLPGVAYLEMARAAVEQSAGIPECSRTGIRLKNVVWARPVVVEEPPVRVHIGLYPEDNGEISYEIYSEPEGGSNDPVVHSQGRAVLAGTAETPVLNIRELKAGCTRGSLSSAECYEIFRSIGLDYGPGHRGIEKVYVGDAQVLARLSLPAEVSLSADRFVIHPGLLDSALQASVGLMMEPGDQDRSAGRHNPVLPFALQELEVFGGCTREMWALLRFSEGSTRGGKVQKIDIDLCDESGKVCVRMRGFSSRVLEGEVGSPGIPDRFGTMILEPVWEEKKSATDGSSAAGKAAAGIAYTRRMVMLCEPFTAFREDIEDHFAGVQCLNLSGSNEDVAERFTSCAVRAFEAIRDILRDRPGGKVLVQAVVSSQGEQQLFSALSGILKTAGLENPALAGQLIETEPDADLQQIMELLEENSRNPADRQIRYRDGRRMVAGWSETGVYENEIPQGEADIPWKDRGIYLITGGAGGLGLIFAREIAQKVSEGVIILTGRSPLGQGKAAKLKELEASGARVVYRETDVTEKEAVDRLIQSICEEFGGLNGIIHAAGVIRDNFIIKKNTSEFLEVMAPKVTGLVNLDLAAADLHLDFLVLFSSGAGAVGNTGQADYSTANAFMDAYASYRNTLAAANRRQGRTLSVGWPLWKEGGMRVDKETERMTEQGIGMIAMQTTNGIRALYRGLASGSDRVMVLEGDLRLLKAALQVQQNKVSLKPAAGTAPAAGETPAAGKTLNSGKTPGGSTAEPLDYGESLPERAMNYLKRLLSPVIKLPADRIEADAPMEKYGIDSIMVMQLTNELEKTFGSLSKTLFFEYQNIRDLTGYFLESHRERLTELLGTGEPAAMAGLSSNTATAIRQEPEFLQEREVLQGSEVLQGRETRLVSGRRPRFASFSEEPRETKAGRALDIAIIGVAGRYPQARNIHEFWDNLSGGRDCITEIPTDRWDHSLYYDEERNKLGKTYGRWGGFLDGVTMFDTLFFNVSPLEAEFMDPQERLFLECAFETLEDAGYTRQSLGRSGGTGMEGNVGVFVGVMWEEYQLFGAQEQALGRPVAIVGHPAEIPNRVSYFCNFHGPSLAVDTMCSSSLTAIHLACQSLQRGECEAALAGGVNLSIHPNKYLLLAQGNMLASKGRCESFGQGGDGYVPAEGVGAVLLKPLARAVADRDRIYGIIKATAVNHGGKTNGFFVPNPHAQAGVIGKAFREAGIDPRVISYIEAHGTGTSLGDPIEITGLTKAFREYTKDTGFCAIGSAKSNIGHAEGAAGIAGVTKILLQLKHSRLAPSLHSRTLNPHIDFSNTPFIVQQELAEWKRPVIKTNGESREYPRIAGVSCFGAGGANAHVVIEEYIPKKRDPIPVSVTAGNPAAIVLSAKNEARLREQAERLLAAIEKQQFSDTGLTDMAYTLQAGREAMEERLAMTVSSLAELKEKLQGFLAGRDDITGMYRGHTRRNKETLELFSADEELQEAVEKWLQRKKYGKLLDLWVKGLTFDWDRLYGEPKPRRIGLPTYPFAREHYWIPHMYPGAGSLPVNTVTEVIIPEQREQDVLPEKPEYQEQPDSCTTGIRPDAQVLAATAVEHLKTLMSEVIKIPVARLDPEEHFEELGLDSIIIARLNKKVEQWIGKLEATIFFKYNSIRALGAYFAEAYPEAVIKLLDKPETGRTAHPEQNHRVQRTEPDPAVSVSIPDIAIIGVAGRYPGADTLEQFWQNLLEGRDSITEIPPGRWSLDGFYEPDRAGAIAKGLSYSKWGGFLNDIDCFDPLFFNISPRDAMFMDPQGRLFLEVAWECLENAGYTREALKQDGYGNRIGVFVGTTFNNYQLVMAEAALKANQDMYFANSQTFSIANRVSYVMNFTGPSLTVDTACSSSLYAIHLACESIRSGISRMAIAGGVNLSLHPSKYITLAQGQFHAMDGRCHAFTAGGTGYVPAEAVGAVFLKPLQDAVRDNDRIYCIIKGTAASHDGRTNGYNVPSPVSQSMAIEEALLRSRIDPRTISCIEAHGTGTALGDPIEITGLTDVFRKYTGETGFCSISSVKSNIGHAEAAAGIAQLTKVILQLKHRTLVKNVMHGQGLNPNVDFAQTPFVVQQNTENWQRPVIDCHEIPRRAGISSFGAGGANAHVVIEEYIPKEKEQPQIVINSSNPAVIVLSARNEERLKEQARRLLAAIDEQQLSDSDLAGMAYTLQVGREAMEERLGIIAGTVTELKEKLQGFTVGSDDMEGMYRGQAKGNKDFMSGLAVDEEMQETTENWVQRGKYGKLLELWVKGLAFDWQRLYGDIKPVRISLPTYPFARERYWIPGVDKENTKENTGTSESQAEIQVREDYEIMTFEEVWQEEALPEDESLPDRVKTVVCFLSNPEHQKKVVEDIKAVDRKAEVIFITRDKDCRKQPWQQYSVSSGERDTYAGAFRDIRDTYGKADAILYMWALEDQDYVRDFTGIVCLLQGLASAKLKTGRILLAGQYDNEPDRCYLESWIGFERSLGIVMPGTQLAAVCRENSRTDRESMKGWIERVWKELRVPRAQSTLYREGKRHILRVRPTTLRPTADGDSLIKPGGTYLITGGCGGLGLLFAGHFAKTQAVNLVLTGRSPMDERKQSKIRVLEELGAGVIYIQADTCDHSAMEAGLKQAKERFGGINGVIHAAGIAGSRSILEKEMESFQRVLAPKVQGTMVLDQLLAEEPLDFTCYFSSSAAILGDFGYCDYAIANRFQMTYAGYRNQLQSRGQRQGKTVVINWPLWLEGGMGLSNLENTKTYLKSSGQRFLETGEGTAMFEQLLLQDSTQHLVMVGQPGRIERMLGLIQDRTAAQPPVVSASPGKGRRAEMTGLTLDQCLERDLKEHIGTILRISRDKLDKDVNLADFGFDSVSLTQLAGRLTGYFGIEISPALFYGYSTVEKLTQYFLQEHREEVAEFYREDIPETGIPVLGIPEAVKQEADRPELRLPEAVKPEPRLPEEIPEPIAIIGMSGRFPQARNIDEMWAILTAGKDAVQEIPPDRFDWRKYYGDPLREPGKTNCKWCGSIDGVSEFDPQFFDIPPRDAEIIDPRQRLLLQESWNALEDAGYGESAIKKNRIGMFVGVEEGDYYLLVGDKGSVGANRNSVLAARLAYFLNLDGPVMAINTACSSGLTAAHQACMSLRSYECDTAIAAGVNLILTPEMFVGMSQGGMLSPDGKCFAFDQRANGMVPGEAVAVVVLKRLSRAEADGDPIYAVIRGSGINYDGKTNGITAPNGVAQTALLKTVYDRNQINPEEIEYIVTHGTGTKLGDPVEVNALYDAFKGYTNKQGFCALTSTKTNFGHTFAASGIVSLISLVQALRHQTIPASLHCEQENDYINWQESPFYVSKTARSWPKSEGRIRTGAVSAFGMSGTNAHMVVQEYFGRSGCPESSPQTPYYLLAFSARTEAALEEKIRDILNLLENNDIPDRELLRISYTLLEGRRHFRHRCAIVIGKRNDAVYVLKQAGSREELPNLFRGEVPRNFRGQKAMELFIRELVRKTGSERENRETHRENLLALADLYCQGYQIEWNQLFGVPSPGRIHLPTYPFAREHYWVAVTGTRTGIGTDAISEAAAADYHKNATADESKTGAGQYLAAVMEIIEEITGFKIHDMGPEERFSEMGLDSIVIMKMAREVLNRFSFPGSQDDSNDLLRLLTEKETTAKDLVNYIDDKGGCLCEPAEPSGSRKTGECINEINLNQKRDLHNITCSNVMTAPESPYSVFGHLAVDEAHPFFFDHPLDHVSGLQLTEAMSQLAKTGWLIQKGLDTRSPVFVSQINLSFNRYCKKEIGAVVSAAVAGQDEDEKKMWFRTEVKQEDSIVAKGHYTIEVCPVEPDIPENNLPQYPVELEPCDKKKVNKHNPVNVLVSEVQTGNDAEYLGCYLCFRPDNGFFNDFPGEFIDTVVLLEACRQTLRVFSAYFREINSSADAAAGTGPEAGKDPGADHGTTKGVMVPVLKSMKIRLDRPIHKQETVFMKKEYFDVVTVGKNTLLELKGSIVSGSTAIGTYEVDSLVLTGQIFAGMQQGVSG